MLAGSIPLTGPGDFFPTQLWRITQNVGAEPCRPPWWCLCSGLEQKGVEKDTPSPAENAKPIPRLRGIPMQARPRTDPPAMVGNERAASQHGNYAASCTTPCSLIQPPVHLCPHSLVARSRCPDCSGSVRASLPLECAPATAPTECRPPSPRSPAPLWHVQEGRDGGREGGGRQTGTCCARFVLGRTTRRQPGRVGTKY